MTANSATAAILLMICDFFICELYQFSRAGAGAPALSWSSSITLILRFLTFLLPTFYRLPSLLFPLGGLLCILRDMCAGIVIHYLPYSQILHIFAKGDEPSYTWQLTLKSPPDAL